MSSLNKVQLIGNLGADPEIRSFNNGGKVANLRLATTEAWKDRESGEKREKTEWHTVTVWNEATVASIEKYLTKGSQVYVEGKLQTRKWQDNDGNDRYSTEVVVEKFGGQIQFLGSRSEGASGTRDRSAASQPGGNSSGRNSSRDGGYGDDQMDDEIPF